MEQQPKQPQDQSMPEQATPQPSEQAAALPVEQPAKTVVAPASLTMKTTIPWKKTLIIILVLALAGGAGWYFWTHQKKQTTTSVAKPAAKKTVKKSSIKGEDGQELSSADLDECHGHTHEITWNGKKVTMYHYHLTRDFPYSVSCFKGQRTISGPLVKGGQTPPAGNNQQAPPPKQ